MVKEIKGDSRLFKHTAASEPKFAGGPRAVIPRHPSMIPDSTLALPAAAVAAASSTGRDSPLRKSESYYRMFHSTGAIAAMRGDAPIPGIPVVASGETSLNNSISMRQSNAEDPAGSIVSPSARRPGSGAGASGVCAGPPERSSSVGCIRRSGRSNLLSTEAHERGCWITKPLSDGSRYTKTKRLFGTQRDESPGFPLPTYSPSRAAAEAAATVTPVGARGGSPHRTGKRISHPKASVAGSSCNVVAEDKPFIPHRVLHIAPRREAPYLTADTAAATSTAARGGEFKGLLGAAPSGKRRIAEKDTMELLHHTSDSWVQEEVRRGPQRVPGYSNRSVDVTNLGAYRPEDLNEKKFRPSVVVMHGPPPFRPQSPARGRSPSRGVGAPRDSDIFPVGGVPVIPFPHSEMPLLSRAMGTFSPLRQRPPNQEDLSGGTGAGNNGSSTPRRPANHVIVRPER